MNTSELLEFFSERQEEIEEYLIFLENLEEAARSGPPRLHESEKIISAPQQKILYSSAYLQLYNLVEATVSRCIDGVTFAATSQSRWRPDDLNNSLRNEWVRFMARTHIDLTPDHRLASAMTMCEHLVGQLPIEKFSIEVGGGGNWDDEAIEKMSVRLGCNLTITPEVRTAAKRHVRDDLGPLQLVKKRRNNLAHGNISFVECADGVTVSELRRVANAVVDYLREAIGGFASYIDLYEFLQPGRVPEESA